MTALRMLAANGVLPAKLPKQLSQLVSRNKKCSMIKSKYLFFTNPQRKEKSDHFNSATVTLELLPSEDFTSIGIAYCDLNSFTAVYSGLTELFRIAILSRLYSHSQSLSYEISV
jgi:hypothetical protein